MRGFLIPLLLLGSLTPSAVAQQAGEQTLPPGYLTTLANAGSPFPFVDIYDQVFQWHYDGAGFQAGQPVLITEISVRALSSGIGAFDLAGLEVVLATSPTEYGVGSHAPIFADNLNADATLVRSGPFVHTGTGSSQWMPLGLSGSFVYDPASDDDFVVQLRKCGQNLTVNGYIETSSGSAGQVGGNMYADLSSCTGTTQTTQWLEAVPVIRIEYQLLPVGPQLALVGSCGQPGSGVAGGGYTPSRRVALGWGSGPGAVTLAGSVCSGTVVALQAPTLAALATADAAGDVSFLPPAGIPASACGSVQLQALDLATCTPSNVLAL